MNSPLPLDSYEVLQLLSWSKASQVLVLLVILTVGVTCLTALLRRRLSRALRLLAAALTFACVAGVVIEVNTAKRHYAMQLLASESDFAAANACKYLSCELGLPELLKWLADTNLPSNTRYYLAAALVIKSPGEARRILESVGDFQEPYFFQSNGINRKEGIAWPASGGNIFAALTNTGVAQAQRDRDRVRP